MFVENHEIFMQFEILFNHDTKFTQFFMHDEFN
jgi:hypothetical protein